MPEAQFEQLTAHYEGKYGKGAARYLRKTYPRWRAGQIGISGRTAMRILECVPTFLSAGDQFRILTFCVPRVFEPCWCDVRDRFVRPSKLPELYAGIVERVKSAEPELPWFTERVFSRAEVQEFLNVARWAILHRLHISYGNVLRDLAEIARVLRGYDGIAGVHYSVSALPIHVEFDYVIPSAVPPFEPPSAPSLVTRYADEARVLLTAEHINLHAEKQRSECMLVLAAADLTSMRQAMERARDAGKADAEVALAGAGGVARITLGGSTEARARLALILSGAGLALVSAATISGGIAAVYWGIPCVTIVAVFVGFIVGAVLFEAACDAKRELAKHERRKQGTPTD